jgi:aarF domain-containing kinase
MIRKQQRCCLVFLTTSAAAGGGGAFKPRNVALGLASGTISAAAITYLLSNHVGGSDGLARTASFYSLAIPKYIQYRLHMLLQSPDEVWDELHKETSKAGLDKILELQGFYIKSGQMCAANIGNAFPKIWQDTMSVLQDECPAQSFEVVKSIVESEFDGKDLYDIFETFEETPIGAASIGQVHRATLKRDGSRVVVKVMYPGVENKFRGDVRTIKMFAQVAQPVHVPPLIEIEKQFMTEFDYVLEGRQLEKVRNNLIAAKIAGDSSKLCAIPKPYLDLCTKRILVMEELNGNKLVTELKNDISRQIERMNKSLGKFGGDEKEIQQSFVKEFASGENGPTSEQYEALIKLLDVKRKASNMYASLYNHSVGLLPGIKKKEYQDKKSLPINHAKLIDDLLYIHGHQVLVDGVFNGDCHPGNILLLGVEEGKPQLGLIDYGQVKTLTTEERLLFCRLIIALADDDKDKIVEALTEAGYKSEKMDPNIMYTYAR